LTEAAELLGVSRRTLERRIAAGALPVFRDGPRLMRVARADLDAYVRNRTVSLSEVTTPERVWRMPARPLPTRASKRLWDAPDPLNANQRAA
jgi:excisionase family DNA binding protein